MAASTSRSPNCSRSQRSAAFPPSANRWPPPACASVPGACRSPTRPTKVHGGKRWLNCRRKQSWPLRWALTVPPHPYLLSATNAPGMRTTGFTSSVSAPSPKSWQRTASVLAWNGSGPKRCAIERDIPSSTRWRICCSWPPILATVSVCSSISFISSPATPTSQPCAA